MAPFIRCMLAKQNGHRCEKQLFEYSEGILKIRVQKRADLGRLTTGRTQKDTLSKTTGSLQCRRTKSRSFPPPNISSHSTIRAALYMSSTHEYLFRRSYRSQNSKLSKLYCETPIDLRKRGAKKHIFFWLIAKKQNAQKKA